MVLINHGIDQFLRILLGRRKNEVSALEGCENILKLKRQQGRSHGSTHDYHDPGNI
jgi:hypothetical protein